MRPRALPKRPPVRDDAARLIERLYASTPSAFEGLTQGVLEAAYPRLRPDDIAREWAKAKMKRGGV